MAKGLTPKQKRFCEEYLIDQNGTQAYIRAGYSVKSENSAAVSAAELLRNLKVKSHIAELEEARRKRTGITADRVVQELAHLAFARMSNVVTVNNSVTEIKNFDELDENELAAIASVKTRQIISDKGEQGTQETFDTDIKMHSKDNALKLLMTHMGMLSDLNIAHATAEKYGMKLVPIDEDE